MISKILSACIVEDLACMAKAHGLLPANQFGCHLGRTTAESLHYVTKFVKDTWRKGEVVSVLFLDIKSAFPSINLDHLIHDMRKCGFPTQYTSWIKHRVEGRCTAIKFDGYTTESIELTRGIDQGFPLSRVAYQFYSTDLVDIHNPSNGEDIIAFMDDTLMLACGKDLDEANTKVKLMMERQWGGLD